MPANPLVLVVDDDEDHATMLEVALESVGFVVVAAHSVAEARDVLASHPVDALVSDLTLGDGTCYDILKGTKHRPRVAIVLSGSEPPDDLEKMRAKGFARHLVKPTGVGDLSRAIHEGLAMSRQPAERSER
jgi:CheY-like chemotaxis protein